MLRSNRARAFEREKKGRSKARSALLQSFFPKSDPFFRNKPSARSAGGLFLLLYGRMAWGQREKARTVDPRLFHGDAIDRMGMLLELLLGEGAAGGARLYSSAGVIMP